MFNLRNETIKAILTELKIDNSPFNIEVVKEFIAHIADAELKAFYMALFKDGAKIFNGLDRVAKIAETFKPVNIDLVIIKANKLIALVYSMNNAVFDSSKKSGRSFEDELKGTKFLNLEENDLSIFDLVKPHCNLKILVTKISLYADGTAQINAFKEAINYFDKISSTDAIEYKTFNALQIKKG